MQIAKSFLGKIYLDKVVPEISKKYNISNPHLVPSIGKVVIGMRLGKDSSDKKAIDHAINELKLISGRMPCYSKAKKSISGFKVRQGQVVGIYSTLRKKIAFEFLERLIHSALPRIRDFKGYKSSSFDASFNFNIGIKEHLVFRELSYDKIYKNRGLDISIELKNITSLEMAIDFLNMLRFPVK